MSTLNSVERVLASVLLSYILAETHFFENLFSNIFRKLQNLISKTGFNFLKAFQRCAYILNMLSIEASAFKVEQKNLTVLLFKIYM